MANWSQLPHDLLEQIVEHLVGISDFIHFRSVCTSWRSAASPEKLRPQPPVLLLPSSPLSPLRPLFTLATRRFLDVSVPNLVANQILASAHGFLLLRHNQTKALSLLNPLTASHSPLPPLLAFPWDWHQRKIHAFLARNRAGFRILLFLLYEGSLFIACCDVGGADWTCRRIPARDYRFGTVAYFKGRFFMLDTRDEMMYTCNADLSSDSVAIELLAVPSDLSVLWFMNTDDDLFLIGDGSDHADNYKVYRLDRIEPTQWSEVEDMKYNGLFAEDFQWCLYPVEDFRWINEECVHPPCVIDQYFEGEGGANIYAFNFKLKRCAIILCGWEKISKSAGNHLWFSRSLRSH